MSKPNGDYGVGYCKPPRKSQFKPGTSGNPKGRKKGTLNLKTDLQRELHESIRIREGEREFSVSKQRAMIKALLAKALKGEARAAALLIGLVAKHLENELAPEDSKPMALDDLKILEAYVAQQTKESAK